jgi:sec-independent protein translocase protein TatB
VLGIGTNELVIILLFAFLLFGPDKLPGMGRTIGRALRQFREAQEGFTQVVQNEVVDPLTDAMSEPTNKTAKKSSDTSGNKDDADADADDVADRHAESFAARRERLKAEKQVQENASEKEPPSETIESSEASSDEDKTDSQSKPDTSAAALYSLTPRKEDGDARD